ncbi:MAG: ABC transporter ATP-binding protein [Actinomycetota bacterium]
MIRASGVGKRFGPVRALHGVDLEVPAGTVMAVFGANGSGKSTLLKIIAGLLRPTEGSAEIAGHPPRAMKARLGYLGHLPYLYPYLCATENLNFYADLYGVDRHKVFPMLDRLGLAGKGARQVRTFSRGEAQRLGLARAMLHNPDYLILDEPFSGLDKSTAQTLPDLFAMPGRTVILSTHDEYQGRAIAHDCLTLDAGCVVARG